MLAESHPVVRRLLRFLALPYCYFKLVNWKECTKSRYQVVKDLLYIFFKLRYFPDNYSPCRFWEKEREDWNYYYGSTYHSYARRKLRKVVQPFDYQIIFNDKCVCEQFCKNMGLRMPAYFGEISPTDNYRNILDSIFNNTDLQALIIKPIEGHAGQGIDMAIKQAGGLIIKSSDSEFKLAEYELKETSVLQEVISQDDAIAKISSSSVNTIRVVTLWTMSNEVIIISAMMRFGVGDSFIDNWSAGGVAVGVNHSNGKLMDIAYDKYGNQYYEHPDSKIIFHDLQIPQWDQVAKMALVVQQSCPFYRMIGMDIAISKDGPTLIEANANPDIIMQEQTAGPLLKDKMVLAEFAKYDLLINKYQKRLLPNI